MSDIRKAAQQMLEALEKPTYDGFGEWLVAMRNARDALRAALAEPTVPSDCPDSHQPQREPLTEEEIEDLYFDKFSMGELKAFARAIERAHGIGSNP